MSKTTLSLLGLALLTPACASSNAPVDDEDGVQSHSDDVPTSAASDLVTTADPVAVSGPLSFFDNGNGVFEPEERECSAAQQEVISTAVLRTRETLAGPEVRACMRSRFFDAYTPCLVGIGAVPSDVTFKRDEFHFADIYDGLLTDGRNPIEVSCDHEADYETGSAKLGNSPVGTAFLEKIRVGVGGIDGARELTFNNKSPGVLYQLADTVWHEATHQNGFDHPSAAACLAPDDYVGNINGLPDMLGNCIEDASFAHRLFLTDANVRSNDQNTNWTIFGPGTYSSALGDFGAGVGRIPDNSATRATTGMGLHVELCDEPPGADGQPQGCEPLLPTRGFRAGRLNGPGRSTTHMDPDDPVRDAELALQFERLDGSNRDQQVPAGLDVSYVRITPAVLLFEKEDYNGHSVSLVADGRNYRANAGDFDYTDLDGVVQTLNDRIGSIYVPPGVEVRACFHEDDVADPDGPNNECAPIQGNYHSIEGPFAVNISYIEIEPAVTVFSHRDLSGSRETFTAGTYRASDGTLDAAFVDTISSIVVTPGLKARICRSEEAGGSDCMELWRSEMSLADWGRNDDTVQVDVYAACGDGVVDVEEVCDNGSNNGANLGGEHCSDDCSQLSVCGNGEIEVNEVCDDGDDPATGNGTTMGGCNQDCTGHIPTVETCVDSCGAQSPGGCFCDSACELQNPPDCCPDYDEVCGEVPTGSCSVDGVQFCGDWSPHGCSCKADCGVQGTCCGDVANECPAAPSCVGHCGGQADGCWCDDNCANFGDCCDDKIVACGA
ncbi:MAG: hypothetical protein K0V04_38760 [Deltaproteobacteria bacterium]|nr:hypothetical protein [Deltaproteobacteria bacterium]